MPLRGSFLARANERNPVILGGMLRALARDAERAG